MYQGEISMTTWMISLEIMSQYYMSNTSGHTHNLNRPKTFTLLILIAHCLAPLVLNK